MLTAACSIFSSCSPENFLCCGQLLLSAAPRFSRRSGPRSLSGGRKRTSRTHAPLGPRHRRRRRHFHPDTASLSPFFSLSLSHFHCLYLSFQHLTPFPSSLFPPLSPSLLILPARHGFMVVKHLSPKVGGGGAAGGGAEGRREEVLVICRNLLSNLSVVVLLCWLGTMRAHVEDMFTVRKSRRGGRSGRESKRRRGGGRKETVGAMTTRVCL